jgi:hypothetical protein
VEIVLSKKKKAEKPEFGAAGGMADFEKTKNAYLVRLACAPLQSDACSAFS